MHHKFQRLVVRGRRRLGAARGQRRRRVAAGRCAGARADGRRQRRGRPGDRGVRGGDMLRPARLERRDRRRRDARAGARLMAIDGERRLDPVTLSVLVERALRDRRGDGRRTDPRRLLLEHQGAPRLLGRAVRCARADGGAGGAHPGPPRRDAGGGRRGDGARPARRATCSRSTTRSRAGRTCPTSRSSRRSPATAR